MYHPSLLQFSNYIFFAILSLIYHRFAQKVDGEYVDPAMKIVLYAVDDPSDIDATIHAYEEEAAALIDADDGSCKDINSGDTMDPSDGQACYNLVFDQDSNDSEFPINTDGLKGMVVFGQHVPIEFERDKHYLKDSSGKWKVQPAHFDHIICSTFYHN